MGKWLLIFSILFTSVCFAAEQRQATKAELKVITASIANRLKDPDSIKISDIRVKDDYVCGMVNAKNSYGGYVGKKPFIGVLISQGKLFGVVGIGDIDSEATVILNMCAEKFSS